MSNRVRGVCVAIGLAAVVLLSACTPASHYGVWLNADDTIDVVLCDTWPLDDEFFVDFDPDYRPGVGDTPDPEWLVAGRESLFGHRVLEYGVTIDGMTTEALKDPPAGWESVDFVVGFEDRDDLVEGEWVWRTNDFPWVPDRPCIAEDQLG